MKKPNMEVARVYVKFNKLGSGVFKTVTPAEYIVLARAHEVNAGGNPMQQRQIIGMIERSKETERERLFSSYPNLNYKADGAKEAENAVKLCFPDGVPIPVTFAEIAERMKDPALTNLPRGNFKRQDYTPKPTGELVIQGNEIRPVAEDSAEEPTQEIVPINP